jgi:MinD-like ATPase involved in chromosome partitioning or flagellar assembly
MGIDPGVLGLAPEPAWIAPTVPAAPMLSRPLGPAIEDAERALDATGRSELLQRLAPESHGLVVPVGWRSLVRAVTFGLAAPGAAAAIEREQLLVARVRTRQSGSRMIAFIAGKGGVGTTTTAIGVALTLATLRTDTTVLVDARSGTGSIGRRVADMPAPNTADLTDASNRAAAVSAKGHGLRLVDAPPWHSPVSRGRLVHLLEDLKEDFAFTTVDAGNDLGEAAYAAFARADQIVIVAGTNTEALDATRVALGRVEQVDPYRVHTAIVAVVCLNARGYRSVARTLHGELGLERYRIVAVPFDPALVTGQRFQMSRLRPSTREAYLRLAGSVATPPAPVGHQYLPARQG